MVDNIITDLVYPLEIFLIHSEEKHDVPEELTEYVLKMSKLDNIYKTKLDLWRRSSNIYNKNWGNNTNTPKTEEEKLYHNILSILNKMSENNFEEQYDIFIKFEIKTKKQLRYIIELIYKKAILEKSFISLYSNLIIRLIHGTYIIDNEKRLNFNTLLMEIFQKKFIEMMSENDLDIYKQKKYIGYITLLGELYNQGGLDIKIICFCLKYLMNSIKEYKKLHFIKIMCVFIEKIGHKLKTHKEDQFNIYYNYLKDINSNKNIPLKEKFIIMDLIEIGDNNKWVI